MAPETHTPETALFLEQVAPAVRAHATASVVSVAAVSLAVGSMIATVFWNVGGYLGGFPLVTFWVTNSVLVALFVVYTVASILGAVRSPKGLSQKPLDALAESAFFIVAIERLKWEACRRVGGVLVAAWSLGSVLMFVLFLSVSMRGDDWTATPLFAPLMYVLIAGWPLVLGMFLSQWRSTHRLASMKRDLDEVRSAFVQ